MNVTATEAKNRFGKVLEQAQISPVFIEKSGRPHSVVLGVARYEALLKACGSDRPLDGRQFYELYEEWVDEQNRLVAAHGVVGEEWRPW